ncbi:MAG: acyl-CoA thioesterase [Pseudomonadota bacterium]|nr:MAG: acyl-CoA thioesterase [Pseudomonadota bacterium]
MSAAQLPSGVEPTLRVVPMPRDTNAAGDVFGGWIMSQVDMAGAIAAVRRARGRVVTVAVNAFAFREPVYVSDIVSFYASVVRVGTTSLTVDVKVYAERGFYAPDPGSVVLVTDAVLTYVAIDKHRKKRAVPPA